MSELRFFLWNWRIMGGDGTSLSHKWQGIHQNLGVLGHNRGERVLYFDIRGRLVGDPLRTARMNSPRTSDRCIRGRFRMSRNKSSRVRGDATKPVTAPSSNSGRPAICPAYGRSACASIAARTSFAVSPLSARLDAHPRPGCRVSHRDRRWFLRPAPGS